VLKPLEEPNFERKVLNPKEPNPALLNLMKCKGEKLDMKIVKMLSSRVAYSKGCL
jgi:hypothetical protein